MPNITISKGATPLNPFLERTMFTSKSTADFPCKTLSKYGAHRKKHPGTIFWHILL